MRANSVGKFQAPVFALAMAMSGMLHAATLAGSSFGTDAEGWRIGEFFSNTGDSLPTYLGSGGNPGGFIRTGDSFGTVAFQAPAAFLGDKSAAYGGTLHVDQRVASHDSLNYPIVLLGDGTLRLQFRAPHPAINVWSVYDISLLAAAGWEVSNGGDDALDKPDANEAQLQQVLANLTLFNLRADWNSGGDTSDLDNVRLESAVAAIPEPQTYALFLSGLGLLGFAARRRREMGTYPV